MTTIGDLWDFYGLSVAFYKRVSIIMLQKVAAMVNKIAADLGLIASKVRLLLHKKFFILAASSAAIFCVPLYIVVMPYLRHYSRFVPKVCEFCYKKMLKASGRC